jgi:hypothetical protein
MKFWFYLKNYSGLLLSRFVIINKWQNPPILAGIPAYFGLLELLQV